MNDWTQYRIKDIARFISAKADDPMLPYIALDNIISWDAKFVSSESTSDGNSIECESGDVLFGKLRPYLAKGFIPKEKSCCSSEFVVLRPENNVCNKFLLYYLLSKTFISYIKNLATGVKMPRINWSQIGGTVISMPSLKQQEAIAAYLDRECEKIGQRIALLERKADAYRRLRRSLINRAVTRGLNPDTSLKISTSSICTDIPAHWQEKRIKDIFSEISIKGYPNEPMLCATQSKGVIPQSLYENRVVVATSGLENMKLVNVGNFVISLRSFQGGIEYAYYRGIISAAYTILELDNNNCRDFYRHFFKSSSLIKLMKKCVTGIREGQNINYTTLKYEHIPVPPIMEQREIAAYLDEKCAKIDAIVEKINNQIVRLKELKRSLINEVVTGKRAIN